ncbi:MAG: TonB-dependent receptor [bacterium]
MRALTVSIISICIGMTASGTAYAQLEDEITVTAMRPVPTEQDTASVYILESTELEIRNSPYFVDQLRAAPGLAVSRAGTQGSFTQVRMRGSEANHTLVLLNGIEISDPVAGETDFGLWTGLPLAKIEVLRGGQSALYGSDAIGGVINIETGFQPGVYASAQSGSFDTKSGMFRWSTGHEDQYLHLSLSSFEHQGIDISGLGGEKDESQSHSMVISATTPLSQDWNMGLFMRYSQDRAATDSDIDFDGVLEDTDHLNKAEQNLIALNATGQAFGIDHLVKANYSKVIRDNFYNQQFTDKTIGQRSKFSYSPSYSGQWSETDVRISGLVDYEKESYERQSTNLFFGNPNQQQHFDSLALAGELWLTRDRLSIIGSLRFDDNQGQFDDMTSWHLGTAWQASDAVKLRAVIGRSAKNPTFTELFGFYPGSFTGNPDLQPELSDDAEIGIDYSHDKFSFSASLFQADLQNEIYTIFNPDFTSSPANRSGKSHRSGIELSTQARPTSSLSVSASLTQLSSENDTGQDEIRVPKMTSSVALGWQSSKTPKHFAGLALDYVGEQKDFFFSYPIEEVTLDAYVLLSANWHYPLSEQFAVSLRGENLLNEDVMDIFGYHQSGTGVFAGIEFTH